MNNVRLNIILSDLKGKKKNKKQKQTTCNQVPSLAHDTHRSETRRSRGRTWVETNAWCFLMGTSQTLPTE